MTVFLPGGPVHGSVRAVASKSAAQRFFLCAALGTRPCEIACGPLSADLRAMLDCLSALGAPVSFTDRLVRIDPIRAVPAGEIHLPCGESAAALRFLMPVVGVLGADAVFHREGRLSERPLEPFAAELRCSGMTIEAEGSLLRCRGRLCGGARTLPGNVSSQFISALLLSLPLLGEDSTLTIAGSIESSSYIALTERILSSASIRLVKDGALYTIPGRQRPALPPALSVEGDWSSAAAFLAMGALSERGVSVAGLDPSSTQGDRAICALLRAFGADLSFENDLVCVRKKALRGIRFDASQTPDLAPVIAALGALAEGETRIENAARLRGKESDRLHTTAAMLSALGAEIREQPDGLILHGKSSLRGGETESFSDHRIAMAAAAAACGCAESVTIRGAECVEKSYPGFWDDLRSLGGMR